MIHKASQLLYVGFTTGQKVDVLSPYLSCLGAKGTMQNLWETLVGLRAAAIKSTVDVWDVLQCTKVVAKCGLHQTVKVACSSV